MQTEAVFENIAERIAEELQKAEKTIYIAIAWFTNKELFDILKTKAQNNCTVFIIINDDEINNNSKINYNQLDICNLNIFKINDTELMHNKFCIIDNKTVITGSYNWSYKAKTNFENIIVTYNDTILTQQFIEEFNRILKIINPKKIIKNEPFPVHIIVKRLEIIKNYLFLEDDDAVINECQKLEKYNFNTDIAEILKIVPSEENYSAIAIIDKFISKNQQIELWVDKEVSLLKSGIKKLENQVNALDIETGNLIVLTSKLIAPSKNKRVWWNNLSDK
ncbi:phospholipase D-like domain-containing protein [Tenacibaculum piscium]|uniref:phospholipase D-like domain-containing protein n=1 Tax=Tenacibaculum piscium TaxID=1458515 RepID=UPI001F2395B7|nr:phospholipase D-like domain-containing protein [Tenacibaculum piscium]